MVLKMKRTIQINESAGMKLKNVIIKEIPTDGADIPEELKRLDSIAKVLGFRLKGPQVIKRWPEVEGDDIVERTALVIQCEGSVPKDLPPDIEYSEEIHSGKSIFVDFTGRENALGIVSNKIAVYAYENDIELTGEAYTIILNKEENIVNVNVHCPIAGRK